MPISREQFEQGSNGTNEQIMNLLLKNPDKAFSVNEIASVIYGDPPADVMDIILRIPRLLMGVGNTLDGLVDKGQLERRVVEDITYYSIHK